MSGYERVRPRRFSGALIAAGYAHACAPFFAPDDFFFVCAQVPADEPEDQSAIQMEPFAVAAPAEPMPEAVQRAFCAACLASGAVFGTPRLVFWTFGCFDFFGLFFGARRA